MRTCLITLAVLCSCSLNAQAPIPVEQEPRHRVVFTDDALRVIDVNVPAGDTTLEHAHALDIATVCIESSQTRTREPGKPWGEPRPRAVGAPNLTEYAGKPGAHTLQNLGTGLYRLIAVENRRTSGWSSGAPLAAPATKLTREARAFRLYDVTLGTDANETTHVHAQPTVAILVKGRMTTSGTSESELTRLETPGQWVRIAAGQLHTISAGGASDVHVTEIELR
jgi:quercetin dioxygenase-like cupin family protein